MFLSIIIPAYNVEKYISRCIESVYKQDIPSDEFEIIVVNDGSTDGTQRVIERYTYLGIVLVNQQNEGLSGARNVGIKYSQGEYIWFVDSDDYICDNILSKLVFKAKKYNLDILFFVLVKQIEGDSSYVYECFQKLPKDIVLTGRESILLGYNPCSVCSGIFRRDFIKEYNFLFYPKLYHQDVEFSYRVVAKAQKILFTDDSPYIYNVRQNSISTSKEKITIIKNLIDDITISRSFQKLSEEFSYDEKLSSVIRKRSCSILFGVVLSLYRKRKMWGDNGVTDAVLNELYKYNLYPIRKHYANWKQALLCKFFLNLKFLLK